MCEIISLRSGSLTNSFPDFSWHSDAMKYIKANNTTSIWEYRASLGFELKTMNKYSTQLLWCKTFVAVLNQILILAVLTD